MAKKARKTAEKEVVVNTMLFDGDYVVIPGGNSFLVKVAADEYYDILDDIYPQVDATSSPDDESYVVVSNGELWGPVNEGVLYFNDIDTMHDTIDALENEEYEDARDVVITDWSEDDLQVTYKYRSIISDGYIELNDLIGRKSYLELKMVSNPDEATKLADDILRLLSGSASILTLYVEFLDSDDNILDMESIGGMYHGGLHRDDEYFTETAIELMNDIAERNGLKVKVRHWTRD